MIPEWFVNTLVIIGLGGGIGWTVERLFAFVDWLRLERRAEREYRQRNPDE